MEVVYILLVCITYRNMSTKSFRYLLITIIINLQARPLYLLMFLSILIETEHKIFLYIRTRLNYNKRNLLYKKESDSSFCEHRIVRFRWFGNFFMSLLQQSSVNDGAKKTRPCNPPESKFWPYLKTCDLTGPGRL